MGIKPQEEGSEKVQKIFLPPRTGRKIVKVTREDKNLHVKFARAPSSQVVLAQGCRCIKTAPLRENHF